MEKNILILLKTNIKQRKSSFISTSILMFIVVMMTSMTVNVFNNSNSRVADALKQDNIGDLMLWYDHGVLTEEMIEKVNDLHEVEKVDVVPALYAKDQDDVLVNDQDSGQVLQFQVYDVERHGYSVFNQELSGLKKERDDLKADEIYLPVLFSSQYKCQVGDEVSIKTNGFDKKFKIKDFIEEPTMGNPLIRGFKNVFISQTDYDEMYQVFEKENSELLLVDIFQVYHSGKGTKVGNDFNKLLNNTAHIIDYSNTMVSKREFSSYSTMMVNIFSAIFLVFCLLLFIVVLIVMGHSITSSIELDFVDLGILKALGVSKGTIRKVYIYKYFLSIFLGSLLGLLAGVFLTSIVSRILIKITGISIYNQIHTGTNLLLVLVLLIIGVGFVAIKTISLGKISPIEAIQGARNIKTKLKNIETPISKKLLNLSLSARQLMSNFKQYISSFVIVLLMAFFIMSLSMVTSAIRVDNILNEFFGFNFDLEVIYQDKADIKNVENQIKKQVKIESRKVFQTESFVIEDASIIGNIVESPSDFKNIFKGHPPKERDEIVITEIFASNFNKKIGDMIKVKYKEKEQKFKITGYYQSVNKAGMQFSMLMSGAKYLYSDFSYQSYHYILKNDKDIKKLVNEIKKDYEVEITTREDVMSTIKTISSVSEVSIFVIYLIAIILIITVSLMVCTNVFYIERKDYGIYKSIGFTSFQLRIQFALRYFLIALLGGILGVFLSTIFGEKLIGLAFKSMGITNFKRSITLFDCVVPVLVLAVTFFVSSYFVARKIKKVETSELMTT